MRRIKNKTADLCKQNDILITLSGIKRGLEAYLRGEFVEHKVAEKRFEKYLLNNYYKILK